MNTDNGETRDGLAATPTKRLEALKDLANLTDDKDAFQRFASRWPVLAHVLDDAEWFTKEPGSEMAPEGGHKFFEQHGYYRTTYGGFSYGEPPSRMPPNVPKRFVLTWQMREALREIWRGNSEKLTLVLFGSVYDVEPDPQALWPPQLKVDWQRGEFVYVPRSEFDRAVYRLFRSSALAKVCANPDCPAPYFIAGRTTQQFCSEKCSGVLQKEHKRRWWKEHGPKWRRDRSRGKRGKR